MKPEFLSSAVADKPEQAIPRTWPELLLSRRFTYCLSAWWIFILAPLLAASLCRPFAWWDYFTFPRTLRFDYPVTVSNILPGYIQSFSNAYVIRPTASLWYDMSLLLFGGEFWIWYLMKWILKIAAIYLTVRLLQKCGVSRIVQIAVAGYLLFHTADFQLMLTALDSWVAFGMLAILNLLFREDNSFHDLSRMTWRRYAGFLALCLLTIGIKEVSFLLIGLLVLAMVIARRSIEWRLLPVIALLALWVWLLSAASGRVGGLSAMGYWNNFWFLLTRCVPQSPFGVLAIALGLLLVYSIAVAWRLPRGNTPWLVALCLGCGGITILFSALAAQPGSRYVIPAVFLTAIPLALALDALPAKQWAAAVFVIVYPLVTAGDLYGQELAYQQWFYEFSEVLNVMETRAGQGYQLATSGDSDELALEAQGTVQLFFESYGPRLYRTPPRRVVPGLLEGWPKGRFVLLTQVPPDKITGRFRGLDTTHITKVEHVTRSDYGALEDLSRFYNRVESWMGNRHAPSYDLGAPVVSYDPWLYLYTVDLHSPSEAISFIHADNITTHQSADQPMIPGHELRYEVKAGEVFKATIPLINATGGVAPRYSGSLHVRKGRVTFGVTDEAGKDLWNAGFSASDKPVPLPSAPALPFDPQHSYYLFFFSINQATEFSIRDVRETMQWRVERIPRNRRYGAMMR
ncbi:MAG: hypothetical protein HY820_28370 [Acidobacteria bacterium]|nr:hypothetical protein [Acidobacteriota bacterium]